MLHHGEYPGESSVMFLPMIDLDPTDPSCIYTTMKFVSSQARRYDATPILTFDQPLYWKALTIIQPQPDSSVLKGMVLRLGGFHMQMSFLGSIGHLMAGSGLQELLEVVFAGNAVRYNVDWQGYIQSDETDQQKQGTVDAKDLYDKAMLSTLSLEDVCSSGPGVLVRIKGKLNDLKQTMITRTAMLWLQYLDMVSILQRLIKAERMANWKLHIQTVQDMLPYFAASGHSLYANSAYVYLQIMLRLPETHPDAHRKFMEGYHVCKLCIRIPANHATSARNSSRCAP